LAAYFVRSHDPDVAALPVQLFQLWKWFSDLPARGSWKTVVRFLSQHSGIPALLVAAILVVVGFRLLRKSARFFAEVVLVTAALFAATQLGWIRW
jgi:hypothetical protein